MALLSPIRPTRRLLTLAGAALMAGGALVLAGSPELALLPWIGIAGLAAIDLLGTPLRRPTVTVAGPSETFVGETALLELDVTPAPARLTARGDWPEGLTGPELVTFADNRAQVTLHAKKRGQWPLAPLWLSWPSRLGLFDILPRVALDQSVAVIPNIRPVLTGEIDVQARSALFGAKPLPSAGEGLEFHQLREFTAGDDVRAIDWKRSARHRALVSREWQAERNHRLILAVDTGHLTRETIDGVPRLDHAINAALAVGWAGVVGGDLVGLYAYDARPRLWQPPAPGRAAFARLRAASADLSYESTETNHTLGLVTLAQHLRRRAIVVAFAEFVDTTSAELLIENAAMLARRHCVLFVSLRDPTIAALAETGPSGLDRVAESVVAAEMATERRVVMQRLTRAGVLVLDTEARTLTPRLVSAYLNLRLKEAA